MCLPDWESISVLEREQKIWVGNGQSRRITKQCLLQLGSRGLYWLFNHNHDHICFHGFFQGKVILLKPCYHFFCLLEPREKCYSRLLSQEHEENLSNFPYVGHEKHTFLWQVELITLTAT